MIRKLLLAGAIFFTPLSLFAQEQHFVSYGGTAGFQATVWAMKDLKTFDKYGLNGEVVLVGGSARQIQGVLGGSTEFAQVDITAVVSANLKGADLVVIGGTLNRIPFSMVTQMPAGGAATRLTALSVKALDATVLSPPETIKAEKLGLRILLHLSELRTAFPMNVVIVRRAYLEKNRDAVKRFMKAHSDAVYQLKHNKKKGMEVLQKRLLQKDRDIIEATYDYYGPKFEFPPRVSREGAAATADELEKEGFFKALGK
ncbi:MAG: ABC transporter substrate-binding protein [Deltaproteobacteria bacterium]|nr:ABC transporter substrate-binding protein [Deltaproteobacteria bacterium]